MLMALMTNHLLKNRLNITRVHNVTCHILWTTNANRNKNNPGLPSYLQMAPSPPEKSAAPTRRPFTHSVIFIALCSVAALHYLSSGSWNFLASNGPFDASRKGDFDGGPIPPDQNSAACPQVPGIHPREHETLDIQLDTLYDRSVFQSHAYAALGGAIQIPCVISISLASLNTRNIRTDVAPNRMMI